VGRGWQGPEDGPAGEVGQLPGEVGGRYKIVWIARLRLKPSWATYCDGAVPTSTSSSLRRPSDDLALQAGGTAAMTEPGDIGLDWIINRQIGDRGSGSKVCTLPPDWVSLTGDERGGNSPADSKTFCPASRAYVQP
jgi:hypothetical protein